MARTKRVGASGKKAGIEYGARQRRAQVVAYRMDKLTFAAIGKLMNISTVRAFQIWQDALAEVIQKPGENALKMELERLDKMMAAVEIAAFAGDHEAIKSALRIMDRRAKYLGLDAPTKMTGTLMGDIGVHHDGEVRQVMQIEFVPANHEELPPMVDVTPEKANGHAHSDIE